MRISEKIKKFYRESHLCSVCGKEFVYAKDKRCFDCREKARKRKSPTEEQKKRWQQNFYSKQRSLYQERVSRGICTKCGKVRAVTGKKKCGACLEKEARAQRKRHESQNVREYREMNNLCYFCGKPIDRDNGRICNACWQRCSEHRKKNSDRKNEFWDLDNKIAFKNYN